MVGTIARLLGKEQYNDWPRSHDSFRSDMSKASGVGVARVRCHRNTWAYLDKNVPEATISPGSAFCPPTEDEITVEKDGMVTVALAGTSLAAVLHFCQDVQFHRMTASWTGLDRAIARRVGSAISEALKNVIPSGGEDGPTTVIYLDDRITAKDASA